MQKLEQIIIKLIYTQIRHIAVNIYINLSNQKTYILKALIIFNKYNKMKNDNKSLPLLRKKSMSESFLPKISTS